MIYFAIALIAALLLLLKFLKYTGMQRDHDMEQLADLARRRKVAK